LTTKFHVTLIVGGCRMPDRPKPKSIQTVVTAFAFIPALAVALSVVAVPATAQTAGQQKIEPALLAEMTAYPLENIPVILEMNPPSAPFSTGINQTLADQAVSILSANGHAFGALSIIQGATGTATSAGITAMSLLPQVATVEQDVVVALRRPSSGGPAYPPGQLTSLYPHNVNANKVWQQGGS